MKALTKTILYLVSTGFIFTRFFNYFPNNNPHDSLWILLMVTLILTAAVLLSALLSVAKTTEMQLNNKVTKETFDRQSGNVNNNRKLLPEAVYVRSGRCR